MKTGKLLNFVCARERESERVRKSEERKRGKETA